MRTGKLNIARREMHIARANENNMRNQLRARVDKLRAENAELTAQLAAAEKDVKRLNDLETLMFNGDTSIEEREPRHSEFRIHTGDTDYDKPFVGTTLRKAIDAAIAAQKETK